MELERKTLVSKINLPKPEICDFTCFKPPNHDGAHQKWRGDPCDNCEDPALWNVSGAILCDRCRDDALAQYRAELAPRPKPVEGSIDELLALRKIVETIQTQHWDLAACPCWVCEEGRAAGCKPRDIYLNATGMKEHRRRGVHVDQPSVQWRPHFERV
jgi:hypothetical protein